MTSTLFLLQMAGTSGSGKSTLAQQIGTGTGAVIIDYDVIKSAALDADVDWDRAGRVGYGAGRDLAAALLRQGFSVIIDSPCRFHQLVDAGVAVANAAGAAYAFIECVLVDEAELRQRMLGRQRLRSQRVAFDVPPPDAPNDVMRDAAGQIRVPETQYPSSRWLQVDTSQPSDACLKQALYYLDALRSSD